MCEDTNRKYFGWSSKYDEEITVTSPRIQQYGKLAKPNNMRASMKGGTDKLIDDSTDLVYSHYYK